MNFGSMEVMPRLKPAQFELANFTQTELNNVMKVLQAVDYLNHCDWFNGVNPLRHMAVKGIYNKYADYISFWDEYSSDQAKGLTDDELGLEVSEVGLAHQVKEQHTNLLSLSIEILISTEVNEVKTKRVRLKK